MDLKKRMLGKVVVLGGIGLIVLGYSIYRHYTAPDPVPEIETVRKFLRDDPAKHAPGEYITVWNRAESALMRRKEYDAVLRLADIMRKSGKMPPEQFMFLDFSEYGAYFFAKRYPEAKAKLDELSKAKLAPEVSGAVAGEKMRCIAATDGIDKAMEFFQAFRKEKSTTPIIFEPICSTAINLLFQFGKQEDAFKLILEAADTVPQPNRRRFLEMLGSYLVRSQKDPAAKLRELMPKPDVSKFFTVWMAMVDEYIIRKDFDNAKKLLETLLKDPHLPRPFRNMVSAKMEIVKEKENKMKLRFLLICVILTGILLPPLFLRPKDAPSSKVDDSEAERLVIITPHNETIKFEWEKAFQKYYREKYGKKIVFDYRAPGGTSDIMRYIADRYQTEFRRYCTERNAPWDDAISAYFSAVSIPKNAPAEVFEARKRFLASDVSIGIDLMAGGGVFDLSRNADRGFAVDAGIAKKYPQLLESSLIPQSFGGENLYDTKGRYYGLCLSTFGICYNADRIAELADKTPPKRWDDLAHPRFYNRIVIADPSKSGSANKCFEVLIQQHMAERKSPADGWRDGLNTIKRIIANAAGITDSAGKVTRDVAAGTAAAGMAIDTYGLTEREWNEIQFKGTPRFHYVAPEGGTAVSPDPIQLLRGAPNPKAAVEFIAFMLSKDGQKIMAFKPGTPGGPIRSALRRPPIRRDLYAPEYNKFRSDPDYNPYQSGSSFKYHAEWTGKYYTLLRLVIRILMLDCQEELKDAWKAIVDAGGPEAVPEAMEYFNKLPFEYAQAGEASRSMRRSADRTAVDIAVTTRLWRDSMRANYRKAEQIARQSGKGDSK